VSPGEASAAPPQLGFARPADLETARETAWQALFEARRIWRRARGQRDRTFGVTSISLLRRVSNDNGCQPPVV
jgi:hypothetical protein